jgi:hypothetical protein
VDLDRDNATLAIAIWGAVTGSIGLLWSRRDNHWKHSHANLEPLREPLTDLAGLVESADPQVNQSLLTPRAGSHIETLRSSVDQVPGPVTRRHLSALATALTAFRGGQQPPQPDGTAASFTRAQLGELKTARAKLAKVEKSLNKAAKNGRS